MPGKRDHSRRLLRFARDLRHQQTDAERKLWSLLRSRRLDNFKFRLQHPIEGYVVDFFCLREKLIVELDGGQHNDPAALEYDAKRSARLKKLGIRVLRFWDHHVLLESDAVVETIYRALVPEEPSPRPSPGLPREGERRSDAVRTK